MSRPQQIATSTIDSDNNIVAQAGLSPNENLRVFATEKELAETRRRVARLAARRDLEQLRGVGPFDGLRQVNKFTSRKAAVAHIWEAVRRLSPNKNAEVITMMKRAKGATLEEIMEATGWQRHTVQGGLATVAWICWPPVAL